MSSSGLIYAVIVGAWAAYLVPMWLRRQDELNESRPTERFSTAIRLLAGRSALERRAARSLDGQTGVHSTTDPDVVDDGAPGSGGTAAVAVAVDGAIGDAPDLRVEGVLADPAQPSGPDRVERPVDDRPAVEHRPAGHHRADRHGDHHRDEHHSGVHHHGDHRSAEGRQSAERRARLLARRRRMVTLLFGAFALGAVVAAVAGFAFIWVPAVPAVLLTLYIGHLRRLERQRYEVKLDRVRAAQAAERLRARERERLAETAPAADTPDEPAARPRLRLAGEPAGRPESPAAAVADATEHEEWVDGMRERAAAGPDSWEPVPVPLPTYVTAPVAPRITRGLDLGSPGTWDSGRQAAEPARTTPLFDQYADPAPPPVVDDYATRPRAANE
ncbi:divisome protein SepX/GlpR [Kitasatospora cinereorecta]|uniref:divisome protein SepX/GlpR n=1 Tax=Kitasatospora cinereorecta TaxID=285560 RepID=UPI0031F9D29F